ncbi:hypothetical protein P9272_13740 [Mesorhizobium sp. WSM4976]|uniref:hypothetical protein n=1 Tax=Mesorhizobium sp. WSM4976 TaxID=3038549 RepID=UPI0024161CA6|nr:hypothetical protein [Mesorhizobium sp. WSM4976]MDG4894635.1 hypothetical protein [Mesorhizobium sp. WSM4976]
MQLISSLQTKPFLAPQTKIEPVHRMAWLWTPPLKIRAVQGLRKRARRQSRELLQEPPVNKIRLKLQAQLRRLKVKKAMKSRGSSI